MLEAIAVLPLALVLGLYAVPVVRRAAVRLRILDRPNSPLKQHTRPVPYLGGVAVFLAFVVAAAIVDPLDPMALGILLGGTIVLLLGVVDDMGWLSVSEKLVGQSIAIFVLVRAGIMIQLDVMPLWAQVGATFVWMLVITNAFNLLDIQDGLAGLVALIAALTLGGINLWNGHATQAILAFSVAGAVAAFLRYNLPPARIYLGDAGSLFLGFLLGSVAMTGDYTTGSVVGALCPLLVLGLPLFEVAFTVALRVRQGKHPLMGSDDHVALRLRARGWSSLGVLALAASSALALAAAGVALLFVPEIAAWGVVAVCVVLALGAALWLGRPQPAAERAQTSRVSATGSDAVPAMPSNRS